jgi:hypothetical protein
VTGQQHKTPDRRVVSGQTEGDSRPGLGHAIAIAVGDAGINMSFVMAQVVGRKYSTVFGFENEVDASKAATLIKRATAPGKK